MQTLFDIRKRTEYASYEKHVDNAPKAPDASKRTRPAANKKVARPQKYAIPKAQPSHRKQDGKKTNPDTLTDDKNTPDTPHTSLYRQRHAPMQTEYPHRINARRSKKLRIDRPSKLFHKKRETSPKKYLDEA